MERKPHWDTDLEQSVSAILFDCYENGVSEEQVYQVIAAVEDWIEEQPITKSPQVLDADKKIQRVREEVRTWPVSLDKTVAACADSVLRALDGGAEGATTGSQQTAITCCGWSGRRQPEQQHAGTVPDMWRQRLPWQW